MMEQKKKDIKNILIIVGGILLVAGLGTLFVNLGMEWFDGLAKPSQWIPNFVIPIVWTIIYLAFAIILSIWITKQNFSKNIFVLLIVNGALNILWCLLFFTLQQLFLGNIIIIINAIAAFLLIAEIMKFNKTYGLILSIYPIWLCIATTLNTATWILN